MEVLASTMLYALGKRLGMQGALAEFRRQLLTPNLHSLPVVRTIYRMQQLTNVGVYVDCGATVIGKARSRAMHAALESEAWAWVSVDDDIEASTDTVGGLLRVLDDHVTPRVVVVPHLLRGTEELSVRFPLVRLEKVVAGVKLVDLSSADAPWSGFGMVGINRLALRCIATELAKSPGHFVDDDNVRKLAAFADTVEAEGKWHGEDVSFFRRIPRGVGGVEVSALLTGHISHDGAALSLSEL